jgi:hypothetical protein
MSKINELISVVISTRKIDKDYVKHISKMFSHPKIQILIYENNGEKTLPQIYNQGLEDSINNVVVFMHDDLILETKNMTPKIIKLFENNQEYGIIGLAGTDNLLNGTWWQDKTSMYGIVGHEHKGKRHVNHYSKGDYSDTLKEVVVVDGLFMMINKQRLKHKFNEQFEGFHFYDLPICLENHLDGVKIGVTTKIRVTHKSIGMIDQKWAENKLLFETLFEKKLPIKIL